MIELIEVLSLIFLILTLFLSVFVVSGVFVSEFKNETLEKTYPRWRVVILWIALLLGYISGIMNEVLLYQDNMSTLKNVAFVSGFYLISSVIVSYFALKNPIGEDENGQKVHYHNVQFFLILALGFLPMIILSY